MLSWKSGCDELPALDIDFGNCKIQTIDKIKLFYKSNPADFADPVTADAHYSEKTPLRSPKGKK